MVEFTTDKYALDLIEQIADRAMEHSDKAPYRLNFNPLDLRMDLSAANARYPLRLGDLLKADDFNFLHDVVGIVNNIDRSTGELRTFMPRFARIPPQAS